MVAEPGRTVVEPGRWCPLTLEVVERLPQDAGVFEVANLVRTVVYLGRAEGSLKERLTELLRSHGKLPRMTGGYYFRYTSTGDEAEAFELLVATHRQRHGNLPPLVATPVQQHAA